MFALTGDEKYLTNDKDAGALDIARHICNWEQWTDPGYNCAGARSCLDTAHITLGVAAVYDHAYNAMGKENRALLRGAIVNKGVEQLNSDVTDAMNTKGGIAAWFNGYALRVSGLGIGASSVYHEVSDKAVTWVSTTKKAIKAFYDLQGKDGGTLEGQLYGAYAMDNVLKAAKVIETKPEGKGTFDHTWLKSIPVYAVSFLSSNNKDLANFADSSLEAYWIDTMFALASRGNATAQWYLHLTGKTRPTSMLTYLWARPDLAPEAISGSGSAIFKDVGHAVLRDGFAGSPVVAITSGPKNIKINHNHYDNNSFIISAFGSWIAADPGYKRHFNAPQLCFSTGTIGHNTIMVDKTVSADGITTSGGQNSLMGGELNHLFDGSAYAKIVANAEATYPTGLLSRFGRRVFYARPDLIFVFDDIASPAPHEFSWLLHAGSTGGIEAGSGPKEMVSAEVNIKMQTFMAVSSPLKSGYPRLFEHPGAEIYSPYAEWRTESTSATRFATALVPRQAYRLEVINPGFEKGLQNWAPRMLDETHSLESDKNNVRSGNHCARIAFTEKKSGYYYSDPVSIVPNKKFTASVYFKANTTAINNESIVSMQPLYMKDGSYIDIPGGEQIKIPAAKGANWTQIVLETTAPNKQLDSVRIALQFNGTGAVWFDDVMYSAPDLPLLAEASKATVLNETQAGLGASGIVVSGPFGTEIGASTFGGGKAPPFKLVPENKDLAKFDDITTDTQIFLAGRDSNGLLQRAILQNGTYLAIAGKPVVTSGKKAFFYVKVERNKPDCVRVYASEVKTLEGPPYHVQARANLVYLNGQRVAFKIENEMTIFPMGNDMGEGCNDGPDIDSGPGPDAGEHETGLIDSDVDAKWDGPDGIVQDSGNQDGTDQGDTGEAMADDSGCDCRFASSAANPSRKAPYWTFLLTALTVGMRSRRRYRS